jgi:putative SOS response-associated peptidase YedK
MCNLYSETKGQAAIRALFRTAHDRTGNLPTFPGIFPDQLAPIVRNGPDGERELVMARWGMPGPQQFGGHLAWRRERCHCSRTESAARTPSFVVTGGYAPSPALYATVTRRCDPRC